MLKIKDNVKLEELEKYGFGKSFVTGNYRFLLDDISVLWIDENTRELSIELENGYNREIFFLDPIYYLIKNNLIEKVG